MSRVLRDSALTVVGEVTVKPEGLVCQINGVEAELSGPMAEGLAREILKHSEKWKVVPRWELSEVQRLLEEMEADE